MIEFPSIERAAFIVATSTGAGGDQQAFRRMLAYVVELNRPRTPEYFPGWLQRTQDAVAKWGMVNRAQIEAEAHKIPLKTLEAFRARLVDLGIRPRF